MKKMNKKKCIFLLADGARPDVIKLLLEKGDLPNIKKYFVSPGSFKTAVTTFPSTTGPAFLPFLTGCYAGTCNVPGIRWFDKDRFAKGPGWDRRRFRSYIGFESYLMNHDIRPDIKTLFDFFPRSVSIFNPITRGIRFTGNKTKISRIWQWYYGHLTDHWIMADKAAGEKIIASFKDDPDFIFAVFPAIDEFAHLSTPFHEKTLDAYREFDAVVGKIGKALGERGWIDDTLLMIGSDHGLSATNTHFDVSRFLEENGIKTLYYPKILKWGFSAASMVSGNGMAHLYFKGMDGWAGRLHDEEVEKLYPGILDKLFHRPEIDLVVTTNSSGGIVVRTKKGVATLEEEHGEICYQVVGADPFGFSPLPARMSHEEALKNTFDTDYPDVLVQLVQVFRSPRTGDVILSATPGYDLRKRHEHPEHKSSHGSLYRDHMNSTLLTNFPIKKEYFRTVDIFPTILHLMGKGIPNNIDGHPLI